MEKLLEYFNRPEISNSDLSLFKISPLRFLLKKQGRLETITSKSMELGSLIHMAILEPEKFAVADVEKPSGMILKYLDSLNDGKTKDEAYIEAGFKMKQETVEKKLDDPVNMKYLEFLKESKGKIALSKDEKEKIDQIKANLESHMKINEFLFQEDRFDHAFNEEEVIFELNNVSCKSKIDRLAVKDNNIYLIDLKTTSSILHGECNKMAGSETGELSRDWYTTGFPSTILRYGYYRQLAFYQIAAYTFIANNLGVLATKENYNWNILIVAVETNYPHECVIFKLPEIWLERGRQEITDLLKKIDNCNKSNNWKSSYEKDGIINLM